MECVVQEVYRRLKEIKMFNFISKSGSKSSMKWNYTGIGKLDIEEKGIIDEVGSEVYFYEKIFLSEDDTKLNDSKMWKFYKNKIEMYRFRNDKFERIFTFSVKDVRNIENIFLISDGAYICQPDKYYGILTVEEWGIRLIIQIKGERKDEEICYKYVMDNEIKNYREEDLCCMDTSNKNNDYQFSSQKYVILDRDGVINVEKNYLYRIEDFEYEEGVVNSLKRLSYLGYRFIIITNQAGIAKGYYTEKEYYELEKFIIGDLKEKGIIIDKVYFCPHHPEGNGIYRRECNCRKPGIGNFLKAIEDFAINPHSSYMIGDRITDLTPAHELGFKTVLVKTGYGKDNISKLKEYGLDSFVVENLQEFCDFLEKSNLK